MSVVTFGLLCMMYWYFFIPRSPTNATRSSSVERSSNPISIKTPDNCSKTRDGTQVFIGDSHVPEKLFYNETCSERHHVIYHRIPKTGSTTMTVLVWRFGMTRDLKFVLPKKFDGILPLLTEKDHHLPSPGHFCDMMALHVFYNYDNYKPYFRPDTVFVSLIREPLSHLSSSIYYNSKLLQRIPGTDKLAAYLLDPKAYEFKPNEATATIPHNPLATFFGLPKEHFENMDKIVDLIYEIHNRFIVVMILERLNESLVMLKRKLCWSTKDILYIVRNVNAQKPKFPSTTEQYFRLKKWSMADYAIYDHFYKRLQQLIHEEGPNFQTEVEYFEKALNMTSGFCTKSMASDSVLKYSGTPFNAEFVLTAEDCRVMIVHGPDMQKEIKAKHLKSNFCG